MKMLLKFKVILQLSKTKLFYVSLICVVAKQQFHVFVLLGVTGWGHRKGATEEIHSSTGGLQCSCSVVTGGMTCLIRTRVVFDYT